MRVVIAFAASAVLGLGMTSAFAGQDGSPGNSASQITGSFSSDCTDFTSTSTKDFSHIDFAFADGGSETVSQFSDTHHYTRTGDRVISSATVKAGTTVNHYPCTPDGGGTNQCNDGIDNDGDGAVDAADSDCADGGTTEHTPPPTTQCSDGVDNDGDGKVDMADPGCSSPTDNDETDPVVQPACNDGVDNDGDGKVDMADPGCSSPTDNDETDPAPVNKCSHGGLTGLLTGTDDPTLAKGLYDAGLSAIPVLQDPHATGPLSSVLDDNLAPINPVGHEAACAVSLLDGP